MIKEVLTAFQRACVITLVLVVVLVNTINWLAYIYGWYDRDMQWQVSILMIAASSFLMTLYIWINENLNKRKYGIIMSGWAALYLLIDLIGAVLGYNLHTKGLMIILLITFIFGTVHLTIRLWQR